MMGERERTSVRKRIAQSHLCVISNIPGLDVVPLALEIVIKSGLIITELVNVPSAPTHTHTIKQPFPMTAHIQTTLVRIRSWTDVRALCHDTRHS